MSFVGQCKYCTLSTDKLINPSLKCERCSEDVHVKCLRRQSTPGGIFGDVFFDFICSECNYPEDESFLRDKMPWFQAITLVLYNLLHKAGGTGRNGYFHWKIHIVQDIDKHWNFLFKKNFKRRKNWTGTVSGTLSLNSPGFFKSGTDLFGEGGWWKLQHSNLTPEVIVILYNDLIIAKQKNKAKFKNKLNPELTQPQVDDQTLLNDLLVKYNLPKQENETNETFQKNIVTQIQKPPEHQNQPKRVKYDSDIDDTLFDLDPNSDGNFLDFFPMTDDLFSDQMPFDLDFDFSSSDFCDESNSGFTTPDIVDSDDIKSEDTKVVVKVEMPKSLFNTKNTVCKRPWQEESSNKQLADNIQRTEPLTSYEENELLNKLEEIEEPLLPKYQRLLAKLRLRKLKRSKNMKIFNIDSVYERLSSNKSFTEVKNYSHLDRYRSNQIILASNNTNSDSSNTVIPFHLKLIGFNNELKPFLSPYTNRILKPYIRRDIETTRELKPLWLKLMNELQTKCNKVESLTPVASIDYCYVRPEHIPAINMLCEQYFWPGINMAESLQYPDFSCVALYKKIVIAFAFMIPDVSYNESYISFIFTRPEWRQAGIATFMLYHLVQTCMGKEVTLHVSVTNPAVLLYQKFGFKVEEFVQDFYEKYMINDRHECKHALFLRLAR